MQGAGLTALLANFEKRQFSKAFEPAQALSHSVSQGFSQTSWFSPGAFAI
jgi:hypothetical protein